MPDFLKWQNIISADFEKHSPALIAFAAPTTNSFKRLVPGFEAPVNLAYSARNRSAAVRIPMFSQSPKAKRLEFRPPDPSCNPYIAFAAMLMAGLDGIQNQIDPGEPLDKDIYDLPPEELANVPSLPGSLDDALKALEDDHEFLLRGDVFTRNAHFQKSSRVGKSRKNNDEYARLCFQDLSEKRQSRRIKKRRVKGFSGDLSAVNILDASIMKPPPKPDPNAPKPEDKKKPVMIPKANP